MSAASEEAVSRLNRVFIKDVEEAFSVYRNLFLEANGACPRRFRPGVQATTVCNHICHLFPERTHSLFYI